MSDTRETPDEGAETASQADTQVNRDTHENRDTQENHNAETDEDTASGGAPADPDPQSL